MAYRTPSEIKHTVSDAGVAKANMSTAKTAVLGVLAGGYIAIAAMAAYTVSSALGPWAGLGLSRLFAGLVFTVGIVMVIVGGGELFTGNMLLVVALCDRRITARRLLRNWTIVFLSNLAGALFAAWLYWQSGLWNLGDGVIGSALASSATTKASMHWWTAFTRGVLCNWLVTLSVWMSFSAGDVSGRILPASMAVAAFVIIGGEHCVANMFYIPVGFFISSYPASECIRGLVSNLIPVALGNVVGGGLLVSAMYWEAYSEERRA